MPFEDRSSDSQGQVAGWLWDFGDGSISTEQHPLHNFPAPGTYVVTLTVINDSDITDTISLAYQVLQPPTADFTWTPLSPDEGTEC